MCFDDPLSIHLSDLIFSVRAAGDVNGGAVCDAMAPEGREIHPVSVAGTRPTESQAAVGDLESPGTDTKQHVREDV